MMKISIPPCDFEVHCEAAVALFERYQSTTFGHSQVWYVCPLHHQQACILLHFCH
jgi:hypothetical protein